MKFKREITLDKKRALEYSMFIRVNKRKGVKIMQSFKLTMVEIFESQANYSADLDSLFISYKRHKNNNISKGLFCYHFNKHINMFTYCHGQYWLK